MTKEVISLSRIVKERDEKLYTEENKCDKEPLCVYFNIDLTRFPLGV